MKCTLGKENRQWVIERIRHNWTGTKWRQLFNRMPIKRMLPNQFLFIVFTGEKCPRMLCKKTTRDLFRAMSLAPRQKCPRNIVEMKEAMAAFFGSDNVAISCHCKRSKIILVKVLTGMCSPENIASWNWRKIVLAWSDSVLLTLRSLVCTWQTCRKRWVVLNLFVYCMFRATRYKKKL